MRPPDRLNVTTISQYIRLENCERFVRLRVRTDEERALRERWHLTIQPLTPLLKESGFDFEEHLAEKIKERGEKVVNLEGKGVPATIEALQQVGRAPAILLQPSLEAGMGQYTVHGRADVLRMQRTRAGKLQIMVADIKASRIERTEHRLQVAVYAHLLETLAQTVGINIAPIQGSVLHIQTDGTLPALDLSEPTFDLETYREILQHLVIAPDSLVSRVLTTPFEQVPYHLSYKCDGCPYNAICMYDSAERLDLSLVPHMTSVEKRVLHAAGITTLPQLASLMDLPPADTDEHNLRPAPGKESVVQALGNEWPVGPNLPLLVQRAKRALYRFDPQSDSRTYLYGAGWGTLPDDQEHAGLIKVFFDAQHDYLQDRVYMISALVVGPKGETLVIRTTNGPPSADAERVLLLDWVRGVIQSMQEVAAAREAPVHLYCYNRYDQRVLLEALKRHLTEVAALPVFFDLLTQSPALSQPIISFLFDELRDRRNLGLVCAPLHDVARMLGFDWFDGQTAYYQVFRAKLFDNRRDVIRLSDNRLQNIDSSPRDSVPNRITIEAAARFNSQIPLEYAYGAWGVLPEDQGDETLLMPYRRVSLEQLQAFAGQRVKALAHIEGTVKNKARFLQKPKISLPTLSGTACSDSTLVDGLREFVYMEHHSALQAKLLNYALPIDRRVMMGLSMLLAYIGRNSAGHRFRIEFERLGLDPVLALNACRLKEGDWVVLNEADSQLSSARIKNGRLAIIAGLGQDWVDLNLLDITFFRSEFRYPHAQSLLPRAGTLYMLDTMADDLNADKVIEALGETEDNVFYRWLLDRPVSRSVAPRTAQTVATFLSIVDLLEGNKRPTKMQREVIAGRLGDPLVLVQGPPGTGKSHTLAWAVLARMAVATAEGRPFRVAVSCKTHNAVNIVLREIAVKQRSLSTTAVRLVAPLSELSVYKLVNDPQDDAPDFVKALSPYTEKSGLNQRLLRPNVVVMGGTPGGLYNLAKYRSRDNRHVDWWDQPFDMVVIDEASQMSLPEGLLALAFLKRDGQALVVGDHRQMPPIVAHPWEDEEKRSITSTRPYLSLFESLKERGFPRVGLDESFRLHTRIADFLQDNIYAQDGIHFHSRRRDLLTQPPSVNPFVDMVLAPEYPIVVIEHSEQRSQQYNQTELALVAPLIDVCANKLRLDGLDGIGVVVPHRAQKAMLRAQFPNLAVTDSIDTVERFQGGERDVIIVSATASDPDYVLAEADFLLNLNRLNVALSRPRKKLIVVASRSVIDLLTSDLEVFENAVIWKRLYYQYANSLLWEGRWDGVNVVVRGKQA